MAHAYLHEAWDTASCGHDFVITGEEARHAIKVSRVRMGEVVTLLNGRGARVEAEVVSTEGGELTVRAAADAVLEPEPAPRFILVQGLAKGGRDEMAVQAAVELGVDVVIPWQADRSVSKWVGEKTAKNRDRWSTIAREASKQSIRSRLPLVRDVVTSKQLAASLKRSDPEGVSPGPGLVFILDPQGTTSLSAIDVSQLADGESVTLIVGPEGGITPSEIALFETAGATTVRLGTNVLRTSTAGPAAIAALLTRLSRW